jgi:hypothetical protein
MTEGTPAMTATTADQNAVAAQLAGVTEPAGTNKRRSTKSRASRSADKAAADQTKPADETKPAEPAEPAETPAPEPEQPKPLTETAKRLIALNALIAAAGELISSWDEAATGVTADEAAAAIGHRLSYCGPKVEWDERLPRTGIASRGVAGN